MEFDLKNVTPKKHKETKKACISFKNLIFVKKNIFCLYFSLLAKLWPRGLKVSFFEGTPRPSVENSLKGFCPHWRH